MSRIKLAVLSMSSLRARTENGGRPARTRTEKRQASNRDRQFRSHVSWCIANGYYQD